MLLRKYLVTELFRLQFNNIRMSSTKQNLFELVKCSIDAVAPDKLVENAVKKDGNKVTVGEKTYTLNNNAYIIGFGKAVLGMVPPMERLLGHHLQHGIVSVPVGLVDNVNKLNKGHLIPCSSKIEIYEGAKNNIPDSASYSATKKIVELVKNCQEDDIIFTLISGGGSALLTYPAPPLTIQDKGKIVKYFSEKGATIQELNKIRSSLSLVKGGNLASMCYPTQMVGLILSDIIGDPVELIASGPTASQPNSTPIQYEEDLDVDIATLIRSVAQPSCSMKCCTNAANVIIGSNKNAIDAVKLKANELGFQPVVLARDVCGEARQLGSLYASALNTILTNNFSENTINSQQTDSTLKTFFDQLESINSYKNLCLIAGGESTVNVTGSGVGGRNQELVMGFATALYKYNFPRSSSWGFCSFGTDGQDGPNPAAGAFVADDNNFIQYEHELQRANEHLHNNDSYNFFLKYHPNNLIMTGLTCTNVMDLQILLISRII